MRNKIFRLMILLCLSLSLIGCKERQRVGTELVDNEEVVEKNNTPQFEPQMKPVPKDENGDPIDVEEKYEEETTEEPVEEYVRNDEENYIPLSERDFSSEEYDSIEEYHKDVSEMTQEEIDAENRELFWLLDNIGDE